MMTPKLMVVFPAILLSASLVLAQTSVQPAPGADENLSSTPTAASTAPAATGPALEKSPATEPDFHLSLTPYLWATGFTGNVGVKGVQVEVDAGFADILDHTDLVLGFMGAINLEYKRFVFEVNGAWVASNTEAKKDIFRNGTVDAKVELDATWVELFAGYRFVDLPLSDAPDAHGRFKLDGFVGGRITAVDVDTSLRATADVSLPGGPDLTTGQSAERGLSNTWAEPFIGLLTILNLDEHWVILLRGDVGGFGVDDSQFSWQAVAAVGYQWQLDGWHLALFAGYRALGQDHTSDDLKWDVVTHGPLLGVSMSWEF